MGERELRGEGRREVGRRDGGPQQAATWRQDQRTRRAEPGPQGEQRGPAPRPAARRGDDRQGGEQTRDREGGRQHHRSVGDPVQHPGQQQRDQHRASAVRAEGKRDVARRAAQLLADVDDRVDDHHGAAGGHREVQGEQRPQARHGEEQPDPGQGTRADRTRAGASMGRDGVAPRGQDRGGQDHRDDEDRRGEEADHRPPEQPPVADEREQRGRQYWADQGLRVVREPGERQRPGVVALLGQHIGDHRLEGRGEGGRSRLEDEDQQVDLPHRTDERQRERHTRAGQVGGDQQPSARDPVRERGHDRSDSDVGDHLDRQRRAEHRPGVGPGEIVGEQAQRHGGQAGPGEGDDLGDEQVPVGAVAEDGEHRGLRSCGARRGGAGRWGPFQDRTTCAYACTYWEEEDSPTNTRKG